MKIEGRGKMLKIYIGETDQHRGQPLYHAIVLKVRELGMAGATVCRGIEGFGANSRIHTSNILRLSEDLPVTIEVVDTPERIQQLMNELNGMVQEGLVVTLDVDIIKYARNAKPKR